MCCIIMAERWKWEVVSRHVSLQVRNTQKEKSDRETRRECERWKFGRNEVPSRELFWEPIFLAALQT